MCVLFSLLWEAQRGWVPFSTLQQHVGHFSIQLSSGHSMHHSSHYSSHYSSHPSLQAPCPAPLPVQPRRTTSFSHHSITAAIIPAATRTA